jgi:hypothetical protein
LWASLRAAQHPLPIILSNLLAALQKSHYQCRTLPTFANFKAINVRESPAKPAMLDGAQRTPQPLSLAAHNAARISDVLVIVMSDSASGGIHSLVM